MKYKVFENMHVILQLMIMMHAMIKYSWWKIVLTFITWLFILCHDFEIVVKGKRTTKLYSSFLFDNDKGGEILLAQDAKFENLHIAKEAKLATCTLQ